MEVLTLQQAGLLAWSKSKKGKSLFATTSIYDSFNASEAAQEDATLQLYSFDVVNRTSSSQKIGHATFQGAQFTSIDWETFGENDNFPAGIIASGFDNGVVGLWDANYIIQNSQADSTVDSNQKGLISLQEVHESPVHTIAFNPFRQHLVASGGVEVAIHNLEKNIAEPDVFSPGSDVHQGSPITSVSWNRKVPHILGSASQNGTSVVWDLKLNKAIFNFSDPSRVASNRNVCLSWNPEIPTQIAVVYDDAKVPELQIWDLRNPKGPIFCTVKGHTKGIQYLDWSVTDPSSIITLGRDNKVCLWNYKLSSDNLVSEYSLNEPASQVKWSPRQPDIYSVTAVSGSSTIYSLNNQLNHIPAWMRTPVGARFSFDGRLAVFSEKGGASLKEFKVKVTDDNLEQYIEEFEKNFSTTKVDIQSLSQNRLNSLLLEEKDKVEWQFIQAAAKNDPNEIIEALGFDKTKIIKKAETYTGKYYAAKGGEENSNNKKRTTETTFVVPTAEEAFNFFDTLGQRGTSEAIDRPVGSIVDVTEEYTIQETIVKNTNWNAGIEKIIKNNILMGNIEGAVDSALKCGRVAEALLLAYAEGGEIFKTTIKSYVTSSNDPFVKNVIRYLVEDQKEDLVQNYSLDDWKECVALCVSLSQKSGSGFKQYMDQIATRFIDERKDYDTALLCYILSRDFQKILQTYSDYSEKLQKGTPEYTIFLMNTIEKIIAIKTLCNFYEPNSLIDKFLFELSQVLQTHNRDLLILNLLTINDSFGFDCLVIKDRLLNSSSEFQVLFTSRNFPFRQENVNIKVKKQVAQPVATHGKVAPDQRPGQPGLGLNLGGAGPVKKPIGQIAPIGPNAHRPFPPGPGLPQQTPQVENTIPPAVGPNTGLRTNKPPGPMGVFNPTNSKNDVIPPPIKQTVTAPPPIVNKPMTAFPNEQPQEPMNEPLHGGNTGFPKPGMQGGPNATRPMPTMPMQTPVQNPGPSNVTRPGPPGPIAQPGPKGPSFPKPTAGPLRTSATGLPPNPSMGGPVNNGFKEVNQSNTMSGFPGGPTGGPQTHAGGPATVPRGNPPSTFPTGGPGPVPGRPVPTGFNNPQTGGDGFPKPSGGPIHNTIPGPQKIGFAGPPTHGGPAFPPKIGSIPNVAQQVKEEPQEKGGIPPQFDAAIATVQRGLEMLEEVDQHNPKKKQEMDQKMQTLFDILSAGTMKPVTINDLTRLCQAIDQNNMSSALTLQQKIAREDYTANKDWLYVMRRIIQKK